MTLFPFSPCNSAGQIDERQRVGTQPNAPQRNCLVCVACCRRVALYSCPLRQLPAWLLHRQLSLSCSNTKVPCGIGSSSSSGAACPLVVLSQTTVQSPSLAKALGKKRAASTIITCSCHQNKSRGNREPLAIAPPDTRFFSILCFATDRRPATHNPSPLPLRRLRARRTSMSSAAEAPAPI